MVDPRPNPECKVSPGCDISFDRSQVTDFILKQVKVDQSNEEEEEESQSDDLVDFETLKKNEEKKAQLEAMRSVTVLFQEPAAGSEDDEDEPSLQASLPKEVKDIFADDATVALVIAFVSPATVQELLPSPDLTSMSDMRSAMVANSQFTGLVSKLGQVLSRYSGIRGIVDIQGNLLK